MVMPSLPNVRHLLFLGQDLYAKLLHVSCSLIALVESNRRILRGSALQREGRFYLQWQEVLLHFLPDKALNPNEEAEALKYLEDSCSKLIFKKRVLENELRTSQDQKASAGEALFFYEHRNTESDTEDERLILGLGKRKALSDYKRISPTLLLDLEKKLFITNQTIGWLKAKKAERKNGL